MQTQQHMSSTAPAPFFLPLQQQSSASSYLSCPSQSARQQRRSPPVQRVQTSTSSFFKTAEVSHSKQKETEQEVQSSSRLTALHSSLQQEAEKIRKWKNATELELKHKEKCLEEANCTIEKQRKNLTELQLKNESLHSKLKDEIANQKELQRKIASTREMCNALKNHSIKIQESIMRGQEDRDRLALLNQERLQNYQELLEKYEALEKGQREWHERCQQTLAGERAKLSEAEEQFQLAQQDLEVAKSKIVSLEEQGAADRDLIQSLREEISAKTFECESFKREKGELEHKLGKKQESLMILEKQVQELTQELKSSTQQACQLEKQLDSTQVKLEKNEETYSKRLFELEASLTSEKGKSSQLQVAKDSLQDKLADTSEELKGKCRELSRDLEAERERLLHSKEACRGLEGELSDAKRVCSEMKDCKHQMKLRIERLEDEVAAAKEELSRQVAEKEEKMEKAETLIANTISRQESLRDFWEKKEADLESRLAKTQEAKEEVSRELQTLAEQLQDVRKSLQVEKSASSEQKIEHEKCIGELKVEKRALVEENGMLKQVIQDLTVNKENLTAQCSSLDQLTAEHRSLKACFDVKASECEGLQKKVVSLEAEALAQSKQLNGAIDTLKKEVSAVKVKEEKNRKSYEMEIAELKAAMAVRANELTSLLEQAKRDTSKTKSELEHEKKEGARKVQDLVAALESYRSEHEMAMAGKDKVLQSLTDQLQESEEQKELHYIKLKTCEEEMDTLRSEISAKNDELKQLLESVKAVCCKDSNSVAQTPLRKKPQTTLGAHTQQTKPSLQESPAVGSLRESKVSSTPTPYAPTSTKPLPSATPQQPPAHPPKPPAPSVPTRLYSYAQTPQQLRSKITTPKYSAKQKRSRTVESGQAKFRGNLSYAPQEEDEAVFKKPKNKDVTIQRASSTTKTTPKGRRQGKGGKATPRGKKTPSTDLSWFDLDSVYGFGSED